MDICGALNPRANEVCIYSPHDYGPQALHSWSKPRMQRLVDGANDIAVQQTRERDLAQFAMFMHARDARDENGSTGVTWSDIGPMGREEYLKDADAYLSAIEKLGYHK